MTLVGLISDTHGLLRPQALTAMQGVAHIIHAGDVGGPEILAPLRAIAPLTVVRGNVDFGAWADALPSEETICIEGYNIHVLHNLRDMQIDPKAANIAAIISGHTHKPLIERRGGVVYVNPGSAGPRRFALPVSVGYLHLANASPIEAWTQALDE
jgi:putative phosphoesterase